MSKSPGGGLAATLVGGVVASALCALLAQISSGLPASLVDSLLQSSPEWLQPFVSELANGFFHDLNNDDMPTAAFLVIQAALWFVMFATGWHLLRRPATPAVLVAILVFSLLFRILLIPAAPVHASEFYRYLWDGKTTASGINPYLFEPAALKLRENGIDKPTEIEGKLFQGRAFSGTDAEKLTSLTSLRDQNPVFYDRITEPHLASAYPPLAQGIFGAFVSLFGENVLALKIVITLFDLGVIVLLLRMLRSLGLRRAGVIFYAWSPLVLVSFANSARYEAIPLFLVLCAISLAMHHKLWRSALAIALAGFTKVSALLFVPILCRPTWRNLPIYLLIGLLLAAAILPFGLWQNVGLPRVLESLAATNESHPSLAGVFLVLERLAAVMMPPSNDSTIIAQGSCAILLGLAVLWHGFKPSDDHRAILRKCFWIAGFWFLLSSQAYPWQLIWVVPFLCAFPRPSWLVLTLTIHAFFYLLHTDYGELGEIAGLPAVNLAIWALFLVMWLMDPLLLRLLDREVSASDPVTPS